MVPSYTIRVWEASKIGIPEFDKKYKVILKYNFPNNYNEMLNWIDKNTVGAVAIKNNEDGKELYIGFENFDDSLIFEMKYI